MDNPRFSSLIAEKPAGHARWSIVIICSKFVSLRYPFKLLVSLSSWKLAGSTEVVLDGQWDWGPLPKSCRGARSRCPAFVRGCGVALLRRPCSASWLLLLFKPALAILEVHLHCSPTAQQAQRNTSVALFLAHHVRIHSWNSPLGCRGSETLLEGRLLGHHTRKGEPPCILSLLVPCAPLSSPALPYATQNPTIMLSHPHVQAYDVTGAHSRGAPSGAC